MYKRYNEFHQVEAMVKGRVQSKLIYESGYWRLWGDYYHDDDDDDEYYGPIELKSEG